MAESEQRRDPDPDALVKLRGEVRASVERTQALLRKIDALVADGEEPDPPTDRPAAELNQRARAS